MYSFVHLSTLEFKFPIPYRSHFLWTFIILSSKDELKFAAFFVWLWSDIFRKNHKHYFMSNLDFTSHKT